MRGVGRLFVFEGPDGVGKSELSSRFANLLSMRGIPNRLLSFPGKDVGTLGKVVYDLHHAPSLFGVVEVAQSSLQLLHIAAHLDAIERTIVPLLRSGTSVVLDRYWWSTRVYGIASGIGSKLLDSMIDLELSAWGEFTPARIVLVKRSEPLREEPKDAWQRWVELYNGLADEEQRRSSVSLLINEGSIDEAVQILSIILDETFPAETKSKNPDSQLKFDLDLSRKKVRKPSGPYVFSSISPAKPSLVYDTYWRFAAERQEIFFKRWRKAPPPWTDDDVLMEYKFTNAYRASDRVSQYLIEKVIYAGEQSEEELFFRILLFKLFNKIETWELLERSFGAVTYRDFNFSAYDAILSAALERKETIYSAAYIMPSGSKSFGTTRKHRAHLKLLAQMMEDEVPLRIAESKGMYDAFILLRSYPMLGDFLAYQYVTDLNYSTLLDFTEMEFVVPGPGAKGGISKCFTSLGGLTETDVIRVVTERQALEFERLGIDFKSLWGRPLQLIDCQNLFCEVDKYARVHHPEITGTSLRTRIKQKFRSKGGPLDYWYPPKWGLNERIEQSRREIQLK